MPMIAHPNHTQSHLHVIIIFWLQYMIYFEILFQDLNSLFLGCSRAIYIYIYNLFLIMIFWTNKMVNLKYTIGISKNFTCYNQFWWIHKLLAMKAYNLIDYFEFFWVD